MTPEQQRIAIAQACETMRWSYALPQKCVAASVPDYLSDLNAMHEAEKTLNELSWMHYLRNLAEIVRKPKQCEIQISQYVHANAAQRAEAFLRTINKWEETKL